MQVMNRREGRDVKSCFAHARHQLDREVVHALYLESVLSLALLQRGRTEWDVFCSQLFDR